MKMVTEMISQLTPKMRRWQILTLAHYMGNRGASYAAVRMVAKSRLRPTMMKLT